MGDGNGGAVVVATLVVGDEVHSNVKVQSVVGSALVGEELLGTSTSSSGDTDTNDDDSTGAGRMQPHFNRLCKPPSTSSSLSLPWLESRSRKCTRARPEESR